MQIKNVSILGNLEGGEKLNIEGFFDVHTHILPEVDDGASSMEMTKEMLQEAYRQGIRSIIATPHYIKGEKKVPIEQLRQCVYEVQKEAHRISPEFRLYLGNELYYSDSVLEDVKNGLASTLADSDYILIEFSVTSEYRELYQALRKAIEIGYRPILAHMERYHCLYKKYDKIEELLSLGVYLQMNASSVIGGLFDSRANYCRKLIQENYIHLLGSDCHNMEYRPPKMSEAVEVLRKKKIAESTLEKILFHNPQRILENKYI